MITDFTSDRVSGWKASFDICVSNTEVSRGDRVVAGGCVVVEGMVVEDAAPSVVEAASDRVGAPTSS